MGNNIKTDTKQYCVATVMRKIVIFYSKLYIEYSEK